MEVCAKTSYMDSLGRRSMPVTCNHIKLTDGQYLYGESDKIWRAESIAATYHYLSIVLTIAEKSLNGRKSKTYSKT